MRRTNVEQAAFVVLKSADIPSLLIESGYVTNARDAKNLDSPTWRRNFAAAIVNGITSWFHERPPRGTLVAWQKDNGGLTPGFHVVKRGDTLSEIAERFGVSMAALKSANSLDSNTIHVGQNLTIPGSGFDPLPVFVEHTISRGETLSQIAVSYSVPLDELLRANQLNNDKIHVGQVIKIPTS
jgi:N-acetylmuramoyl-L-alanine amidase